MSQLSLDSVLKSKYTNVIRKNDTTIKKEKDKNGGTLDKNLS